MTSKRAASNYLTHENWDHDDEPEEAGVFKQADESKMKERVIKKAKRRGIVADGTADKPALFTGFAGFGIPTAQNPTFSFNKKDGGTEPSGLKISSFGSSNGDSKSAVQSKPSDTIDENTDINKSKFLAALKLLNESMLKWLNRHTAENPYCYFTPVFADYATHLANIKAKYKFEEEAANPASLEEVQQESSEVSQPTTEKTAASESIAATSTLFSSAATPPTTMSATTPPASVVSPTSLFKFGTTEKAQPESKKADKEKAEPEAKKADEGKAPVFPLFGFGGRGPVDDTAKDANPKPFSFVTKPDGSDNSKSDNGSGVNPDSSTKDETASAPTGMFSFGKLPATGPSTATGSIFGPSSSTSGAFSFGLSQPPSTSASAAPTFAFGKTSSLGSTATSTISGFSFKSDVAQAKSADSQSAPAASNDDEEYVPPKAEVENKITEDDALYTKRVKLFYNKDGEYVNKGVGNLFIKPLENGKNGLLIRADTNLGTILLNISLSESIPVQRQGKNNVTLVCVPNPPMELTKEAKDPPPPTMLLIRVKESADADELRDKLNEFKTDS